MEYSPGQMEEDMKGSGKQGSNMVKDVITLPKGK